MHPGNEKYNIYIQASNKRSTYTYTKYKKYA